VGKLYANHPDTPVALVSASKYCHMLQTPPGALQSALRLCKSILTCSWKHLQCWRCIQDSARFYYYDGQILELLRPAQVGGKLGAVLSHQWFLAFLNHKAFHRSYWSLLQSHDSLHHYKAGKFYISVTLYIQMANPTTDGIESESQKHLKTLIERS